MNAKHDQFGPNWFGNSPPILPKQIAFIALGLGCIASIVGAGLAVVTRIYAPVEAETMPALNPIIPLTYLQMATNLFYLSLECFAGVHFYKASKKAQRAGGSTNFFFRVHAGVTAILALNVIVGVYLHVSLAKGLLFGGEP